MTWIERLIIVLVSAYVIFMIGLIIYNKRHHKPSLLNDCSDCQHKGKELLAEYRYQKRKEARIKKKELKRQQREEK
ncbi:MAG: hypothetical protein WCR56_04015 [Bacilli bacterium]